MKDLNIPAIGGKDSMSGTYEDITVPPTLISFAVTKENIKNIVSRELKSEESTILLVEVPLMENGLLNIDILKDKYRKIKEFVNKGYILSASTIASGGIGKALVEMAMGNNIGVDLDKKIEDRIFKNLFGSIIIEVANNNVENLENIGEIIGQTNNSSLININNEKISIELLKEDTLKVLNDVYPIEEAKDEKEVVDFNYNTNKFEKSIEKEAKVLIPVFPGTNGEYDLERSFIKAGAKVEKIVFNTLTKELVEKSYIELKKAIERNNILAFANGALMGEELESNGKLIELILSEETIKEAVEELIKNRKGLVIGLGAGFTGLVNSGLIEFGEIKREVQ